MQILFMGVPLGDMGKPENAAIAAKLDAYTALSPRRSDACRPYYLGRSRIPKTNLAAKEGNHG